MILETWVQQFGDIDPAVSTQTRSVERAVVEAFPGLNIDMPVQTYRRYGHVLANYAAQKFWLDCCSHHQLSRSVFDRFRARILNSGMSALVATIEALDLTVGDIVIYHKDCYFATGTFMQMLERRGVNVHAVDIGDLDGVRSFLSDAVEGRRVIVTESVTNHVRMVTAPLSQLVELAQSTDTLLVIDNTLPSAVQIDPEIFNASGSNVLYMESLTKYYHAEESGRRTIGITIFPNVFRESVDRTVAVYGFYLQLPEVLALPTELFRIGASRVARIARNAEGVAGFLLDQQGPRRLPFRISLPVPFRPNSKNIPWPGVLFLQLETHGRCSARDCAERLVREAGFPERGSFGHRNTTILPIGLRWPEVDDGIVRLAIGSEDPIEELRERLQRFLEHY